MWRAASIASLATRQSAPSLIGCTAPSDRLQGTLCTFSALNRHGLTSSEWMGAISYTCPPADPISPDSRHSISIPCPRRGQSPSTLRARSSFAAKIKTCWIHIGSEKAGPKVAAIFSIVESCRRLPEGPDSPRPVTSGYDVLMPSPLHS
jgi:hypothetical protein